MTDRMKRAPLRSDLDELIRKSIETVDKMTPEQREQMFREQAQSWARQTKD